MNAVVVTAGLVLTAVVVITVVVWRLARRERAAEEGRAAALADYLGVPLHRLPRGGQSVPLEFGGAALTVHWRPADRRQRGRFELRVALAHAVELEVRNERRAERIGKQLGLVREVQSGDARFDARCFVDTAQVDFARRYLAEPARRAHILALLEAGFDVVRLDADGVAAIIGEPGLSRPDAVRMPPAALATALHALAQGLPRSGTLVGQRRAWRRHLAVVYAGLGLLVAAGLGGFVYVQPRYPVLDGFAFLRFSLLVSGPATVLLGALVIAVLRGHSSSLRHCFAALALVVTAGPAGGWAGALVANAELDAAPPQARVVPVTGRRLRHVKNGTVHYVRVVSWRPGHSHEEFRVPEAVYAAVRPGRDAMRVVTGPGRFGFEWYVAHDLVRGMPAPDGSGPTLGAGAALPEFQVD
ncbi:MAG: hypothetical protein H6977_03760 [Gammaproteobacteria bacterium]|nr:hypothetical protein [Gammaproteobacteria bacterium]MCP5199103.1 hypothetical protein [Gammaproteobacteria bacterium]